MCTASPGCDAVFTPKSSLTLSTPGFQQDHPRARWASRQGGRVPRTQRPRQPRVYGLACPGLHLRGRLCLPCAPAAPGLTSSPDHTSPSLRGGGGHHQAFPSERVGVTITSLSERAGVTPSLPLRAAGPPLSSPSERVGVRRGARERVRVILRLK